MTTYYPVVLKGNVYPVTLDEISASAYALVDSTLERITEEGDTRITEEGDTRILDGFDYTVTPYVYPVILRGHVYPVEVE